MTAKLGRPKENDRPKNYDPEVAEEIHRLMVDEGRSILWISKQDHASAECRFPMPHRRDLYRWRREVPEFDAMVSEALENQGHFHADRLGELIDLVLENPNQAQAVKVAIDATKTRAMWLNRHYADRQQVAVDPISHRHTISRHLDFTGLSEEQITLMEEALRSMVSRQKMLEGD